LAQRGKPVEHDTVIAEIHRPKTLEAMISRCQKKLAEREGADK